MKGKVQLLSIAVSVVLLLPIFGFSEEKPALVTGSRPPEQGCVWKRLRSETSAFSLLVQDCDYGFRRITHAMRGSVLYQQFSDSPEADGVIEIFKKEEGDTPAVTLEKLFISKLDPYERKHCIAREAKVDEELEAPFADKGKSAWVIVPDAEYMAKIDSETQGDEIPETACGEYGLPFDSRAYFEFHARSAGGFAWVIIGQDTPLFDEQSLQF